ncbi:MAG: Clp1/GlmU family protein, partial [Candidatus Bathyarchaeia archaeon]
MRFEIQSGRTLLISGPASLTIEKGSAEILGAPLDPRQRVVIKKEKQLPIETVEDTVLEARLGERASYLEIEGTTIPESWYAAVEAFKSLGNGRAFVLGSADTGKSTFCTFLTNHMFKTRGEVSVVDADIGQSDLGPPGTIGLSIVKRPLTALENAGVYRMAFVGETSPSAVTERVIESVVKVADLASEDTPMVINTDGSIADGDAVAFKVRMIRRLMPDLIIGLAERNELDAILDATTAPTVKIQVPKYVKARGREDRRRLREHGYRRYLRGAVHKNFS